jgi:hypothetical protein
MSNGDFSDGSSGPNAGPFGSIPLMAPPPTFNPLVPGGLPPPNPGRASGASKVRFASQSNLFVSQSIHKFVFAIIIGCYYRYLVPAGPFFSFVDHIVVQAADIIGDP